MGRRKQQQEYQGVTKAAWCEAVYLYYPRRVAHKVAIASIGRAIDEVAARNKSSVDEAAEWLAERVKIYALAVQGQTPKYIPYPSTWFNQGRYDDDPTEWEAWKQESTPTTREGDVATGFLSAKKNGRADAAEQERIRRELREAF